MATNLNMTVSKLTIGKEPVTCTPCSITIGSSYLSSAKLAAEKAPATLTFPDALKTLSAEDYNRVMTELLVNIYHLTQVDK